MRKLSIRWGTGVAALALVGALQVPSSAADRGARASATSVTTAAVAKVKIVSFAFKPGTLNIAKGAKVTWTNSASIRHTSTSNTGVWSSGAISPDATFSRVFRKIGTFKYHCTIHPDMHGKIVVT